MKTRDLRSTFLEFFEQRGHTVTPSASLVPSTDPTLLFTTAGMVPFKDVFTGKETLSYSTAASCQKCVRAGGKHNDLEQVGHTARHHTFFEMLGNFSFGDYFKEKAILYAWTLLTDTLGLSKDKLWITIYHNDEEAFSLWKKIAGVEDHRIIRIATQDNFWAMGDTGPCGPCSEIFYDHGPHIQGGPPGSAEQDGDRFVELWNLVFMSYELISPDQRVPLAKPSIDTGMGIERAAAVLQGVHDNFETDIFKALIQCSADLSHTHVHGAHRIAHRVIADHLRSISFLIADGVLPSAEGRGYVVRRILRRALRHVHQLGAPASHLADLLPTLVEEMGSFYPHLARALPTIKSTLNQEAERFETLLERGLSLLSEWLKKGESVFPGEKAFQLYDTYGFPLDMTEDILKEKNITVDVEVFEKLREQQREKSRASWVGSGSLASEEVFLTLKSRLGPTAFDGYDSCVTEGVVQCLLQEGQEVQSLGMHQTGYVIVDRSSFYGESGGQEGDQGYLKGPSCTAIVLDTQKKEGLLVHEIRVTEGHLQLSDTVSLFVDEERRKALRAHHSATHLMHAALREVLGDHVMQKGSLVTAEKLRFDFSHTAAVTASQIQRIEVLVNQAIWDNHPVDVDWKPREEAITSGAMALFGEKYEDTVRLVTMGSSKELCGGTHVQRTGEIGSFKIISEASAASGIRRIEAVAQEAALRLFEKLFSENKELASCLKVPSSQIKERVQQLLKAPVPVRGKVDITPHYHSVAGKKIVYASVQNQEGQTLKEWIDRIKQDIQSGIILLNHAHGGKVTLIVGITPDLSETIDAVFVLNALLPLVGGTKGGGRKDLAQGGGPHSVEEAVLIEHLCAFLSETKAS
jgi:alanyl-tRNA synthetase